MVFSKFNFDDITIIPSIKIKVNMYNGMLFFFGASRITSYNYIAARF